MPEQEKQDTSAEPHRRLVIALSAIPNTGKTTLFNRLTGANQSTGNWPGVSVERRSGRFRLGEFEVELVDLPGAYALSPVSREEQVVRHFFLHEPPDVVLNVLDARNLYRGLGLTLQMAQSGLPMVVAVNMMDEARRTGLMLDLDGLASHLGCRVVPISARTGEGIPQLLDALYETAKSPQPPRLPHISCAPALEEAVKDLARRIERHRPGRLNQTFLATRLLEDPEDTDLSHDAELIRTARDWRRRVEQATGSDIPVLCTACRLNAARGLALEITRQRPPLPDALSERLDAVLLHRWLGLPLFALAMWLLFQAVFGLGTPLQAGLGAAFDTGEAWLRGLPLLAEMAPLWRSFLLDGLWHGVGVVASFFPIIALFFLFMSLIEDSGYMARAAFLMDRLMHRLGLDGKAFISLLLGYGCNVPAVMGTRILAGRRNRLLTMLLIPFTLCSARLQVFVFLAGILFSPRQAPWVLFGLYLGSFAAVVLMGLLARLWRGLGPAEPFLMEIPPYRLPSLRSITLRTWQELKDFLYRAATLIVAGVVLVWLLTHFPAGVPVAGAETWAGQLGQVLAPVFAPLGIHWQETVALLFGFVAKEVVVGALAVIYGSNLTAQIAAHITPLQGISFMVFTLLYTPCVATLAAIHAESRSWRITALSVLLGLASAWLASLLVYRIGLLLGNL